MNYQWNEVNVHLWGIINVGVGISSFFSVDFESSPIVRFPCFNFFIYFIIIFFVIIDGLTFIR